MALYKLDEETGEAVEVEKDKYVEWCGKLHGPIILARHEIIEYKHIKALAVDVSKGEHHNGKVLAAVVTRLVSNTYYLINNEDYHTPPWETRIEGDEPEFYSGTRAQALQAHRSLVNRVTKDKGGRVLI